MDKRVPGSGVATAAVTAAMVWTAVIAQEIPAERAAERISQQAFKTLFARKDVSIVDTRDEDSYRAGRVPGAVLLPLERLSTGGAEARAVVARLKRSGRPVVVYCACPGETSSLRVATLLQRLGIRDARALTGGWVDWFNDGNPIARGRER